jgi:hypothetical protein
MSAIMVQSDVMVTYESSEMPRAVDMNILSSFLSDTTE